MAGLLSSAASKIGGLFGTPEGRGQVMEIIASGIDGDRWKKKLLVAEEMRRQEEQARLKAEHEFRMREAEEQRKRTLEARAQLEQFAKLDPKYLQQYQDNPAFQSAFRNRMAATGDVGLAEQAGLIQPQSQPGVTPEIIRVLEHARSLPEGDPDKERLLKWVENETTQSAYGSAPYFTALPTAGGYVSFNSRDGTAAPLNVGMRATDDPALQQQIATGKGGGKVLGESGATAIVELPKVEMAADYMTQLLGALKTHPGLPRVVGASSAVPLAPFETEAASFVERLKQVQGRTFLEAYQMLKGGGQITEIEGQKAEAAIARLGTAQSEQEFTAAITELEGIVRMGVERARRGAASGASRLPGAVTGGGPAAQEFPSIVPGSSPNQRLEELRRKHGLLR